LREDSKGATNYSLRDKRRNLWVPGRAYKGVRSEQKEEGKK